MTKPIIPAVLPKPRLAITMSIHTNVGIDRITATLPFIKADTILFGVMLAAAINDKKMEMIKPKNKPQTAIAIDDSIAAKTSGRLLKSTIINLLMTCHASPALVINLSISRFNDRKLI